MPTDERDRLAALRETVETAPGEADWRALCTLIASGDSGVRSDARDVRSELLEAHPDPAAGVAALGDLLTADGSVRRTAVDTLSRLVRRAPCELVPRVNELLAEPDGRLVGCAAYVVATAANQTPGLTKPAIPKLVEALDHEDLRVRSLSMYALATIARSYPRAVTAGVPRATPLLEFAGIAGGEPDRPGVDPVPDRDMPERLTPRLVRPRRQAAEFLETVGSVDPAALRPAVEPLGALLADVVADGADPPARAVRALFHVATVDPDLVRGAVDVETLRRLRESEAVGVGPAAENLLVELGELEGVTDGVGEVTLAARTEPVRDGDAERARALEMEIHEGAGVDLEEVLRLLRSTDAEIRDDAAFSAQFLADGRAADVDDRAEAFLGLVGDPHDCARGHLVTGPASLLPRVAASYPRRWLPALVDLLDHEEPRVRADALYVMAPAARTSPSSYRDRRPDVRERLRSDHPAVRRGALKVLAAIGTAYPDAVAEAVPRLDDHVRSEATVVEALVLVTVLARRRPAAVDPVVDDVLEVFRELAATDVDGGEAVTDPAGREAQLGDADRSRRVVLDVVFELAKTNPGVIRPEVPLVAELVEARVDGWQTALDVLVELDAVDEALRT